MIPCTVIIRAGKRTYRVSGELPSDAPTVAEKQAAAATAVAALTAAKGSGYGYTDTEPDWSGAVAQSVEWLKTSNV